MKFSAEMRKKAASQMFWIITLGLVAVVSALLLGSMLWRGNKTASGDLKTITSGCANNALRMCECLMEEGDCLEPRVSSDCPKTCAATGSPRDSPDFADELAESREAYDDAVESGMDEEEAAERAFGVCCFVGQ